MLRFRNIYSKQKWFGSVFVNDDIIIQWMDMIKIAHIVFHAEWQLLCTGCPRSLVHYNKATHYIKKYKNYMDIQYYVVLFCG